MCLFLTVTCAQRRLHMSAMSNYCRIPHVCKMLSLEAPSGAAQWDREHVRSQKPHKSQLSAAELDPILQLSFQTVSCFYIPNVISWDCDQLGTYTHTHVQSYKHELETLFLFLDEKRIIKVLWTLRFTYSQILTGVDLWPLRFCLIWVLVLVCLRHTCPNNKEPLLHV